MNGHSKKGGEMTEKEETKKHEYGLFHSIIACLGSTFGIEFFMLLGYSIQLAGPAIVISLILGGIINLIIMLNYAELSSSISKIGAEYTFVKAAFGGYMSFLSGWLRWLSSIFTSTLSAMGLAIVINNYFFPYLSEMSIAVVLIAIFTIVNIKGGRKADLTTVLSFIIVFSILIIVSVTYGFNISNFQPFFSQGYSGILAGMMYSFSMFVGMRAIAIKSPMMKEPGKILPKTIWYSSLITILTYCSIAYVVVGTISIETIGLDQNIAGPLLLIHVGKIVMSNIGQIIVMIAFVAAAFLSLATSMSVQVSIISALSRDGYLPRIIFASRKKPITRYIVQFFGSLLAMTLAGTGVIVFVGYASGFASLLVFAIVNLSLIKLRKLRPFLKRPFKTPLYPFTPIFGILVALVLMVFVENTAVSLIVEFIVISFIIYHLKMLGYYRLRIAIGGINIGIGGFLSLMVFLLHTETIGASLFFQERFIIEALCITLSFIFFTAGFLNLIRSKKIKSESIDKLWLEEI
jgi:APA family basic amino acid/polyamine antiporter